MNTLIDRLEHIYRERPDLEGDRGQIGLVRASRASKSVVNQWLTGKIKSMDIRYALNIEEALGYSHIWLMTGFGAPLAEENFYSQGGLRLDKTEESVRTVAVQHVKFQAGKGGKEPKMLSVDGPEVLLSKEWIKQHMMDSDKLVSIEVGDRGMEPLLFPDDIVVVDLSDRRPVSREIYALQVKEQLCFRQLLLSGSEWQLHAINPGFERLTVRSEELKILGRVVYQSARAITGRL